MTVGMMIHPQMGKENQVTRKMMKIVTMIRTLRMRTSRILLGLLYPILVSFVPITSCSGKWSTYSTEFLRWTRRMLWLWFGW